MMKSSMANLNSSTASLSPLSSISNLSASNQQSTIDQSQTDLFSGQSESVGVNLSNGGSRPSKKMKLENGSSQASNQYNNKSMANSSFNIINKMSSNENQVFTENRIKLSPKESMATNTGTNGQGNDISMENNLSAYLLKLAAVAAAANSNASSVSSQQKVELQI